MLITVLKIELFGKGLTLGYSVYGGSGWWAPAYHLWQPIVVTVLRWNLTQKASWIHVFCCKAGHIALQKNCGEEGLGNACTLNMFFDLHLAPYKASGLRFEIRLASVEV